MSDLAAMYFTPACLVVVCVTGTHTCSGQMHWCNVSLASCWVFHSQHLIRVAVISLRHPACVVLQGPQGEHQAVNPLQAATQCECAQRGQVLPVWQVNHGDEE
jgi:hypothetical protein